MNESFRFCSISIEWWELNVIMCEQYHIVNLHVFPSFSCTSDLNMFNAQNTEIEILFHCFPHIFEYRNAMCVTVFSAYSTVQSSFQYPESFNSIDDDNLYNVRCTMGDLRCAIYDVRCTDVHIHVQCSMFNVWDSRLPWHINWMC